ncbi:MAG: hypothetical protein Q7W05_02685 [Deltaproteobacteria bacterium]|nr:hypothetical protein [Deltaproteobacteria bacterium]
MIGSFAEQLTHAQFSQHEERQADQYAADFLQAEGYQIASAVSALNKPYTRSEVSGRNSGYG